MKKTPSFPKSPKLHLEICHSGMILLWTWGQTVRNLHRGPVQCEKIRRWGSDGWWSSSCQERAQHNQRFTTIFVICMRYFALWLLSIYLYSSFTEYTFSLRGVHRDRALSYEGNDLKWWWTVNIVDRDIMIWHNSITIWHGIRTDSAVPASRKCRVGLLGPLSQDVGLQWVFDRSLSIGKLMSPI